MKILINEQQYFYIVEDIKKEQIGRMKFLNDEQKEIAQNHLKSYSSIIKGKIFELELPNDFKEKLNSKKLPNGFSMGIDKNGYFIQTHRARSKSYKHYLDIPEKDIKFIDSTG
jgi:uncharacterized protein YutD